MNNKAKALISIAILLLAAVVLSISNRGRASEPFHGYKQHKISINGIQITVFLANTPEKTELGLGGVAQLSDDQGMLFSFSPAGKYPFWMKGMKIPIDIIWLRDNKVVFINHEVPVEPGVVDVQLKRYSPDQDIDGVLEVRSGWAKDHGVEVGAVLKSDSL